MSFVSAGCQQVPGPQGELEGQEDDHHQPEELDKEAQVVPAAGHKAPVWGQWQQGPVKLLHKQQKQY